MNDPVVTQLRNERSQIVEAASHVVEEWKAKMRAELEQEMRSVMARVLVDRKAMCDDTLGSESIEESSESVAISMLQDVKPTMSLTQLKVSCLTPPWGGIFDL